VQPSTLPAPVEEDDLALTSDVNDVELRRVGDMVDGDDAAEGHAGGMVRSQG